MTQSAKPKKRRLSRIVSPVRALLLSDAFAGIFLILVAIAAMVAANSIFASNYNILFHKEWAFSPITKLNTLHLWINDALMAVFFFVVGLEVKREFVVGDLADASRRRLPMLAALAGMITPAIVYLGVVGGEPKLTSGWAIPAATDIAFAMGVIGLLGKRVPASLKLFLLTVAIVDDIGAVVIIALAYTPSIKLVWLFAAMVMAGFMILLGRLKVARFWPYIILSIILWYCVLHSGVHATIAGVVAALTIPLRGEAGHSMLERMEHSLAPWNAYFIVPLFGFANAGVSMGDLNLSNLLDPLPLGVALGLFFGKQVGVFASVWAADKLGFAKKPKGANWLEIWGVCILCGIGFTMSLFIGGLAFPRDALLAEEAKLGILLGSCCSAILGYLVLRIGSRKRPSE